MLRSDVATKFDWSLMMKRMDLKMLMIATIVAVVLSISLSAQAQDASGLYKSKCAMCHGADGSKITAHNFQSADVQKQSDSDLADVITNGKGKMPAYKTLKPEDVKGLVAYIRTLKK
jgi:cytochrome c6